MRFFKRNLYGLLVVAVAAIGMGMVTWQQRSNETRHVQRREDFILLALAKEEAGASHLYQKLVQSLRREPDLVLLRDQERLAAVVLRENPLPNSLLSKLHHAVLAELKYREKDRIRKALDRIAR
jgi:hypothetical protein